MYLDGWVSQLESHSFRQSDSINKSSRLIHDRLLAPVPYCVNTMTWTDEKNEPTKEKKSMSSEELGSAEVVSSPALQVLPLV